MAENQLLPFANGDTANVIPFADWNSLAARLTGFQSGIASSQQFNYILAQGGSAGYVIGQLVADYTTETATIAATPLYQAFKQALAAFVPKNIANGSIATQKLADKSVTQQKLADKSVTQPKIADNAVGADQLANGAVNARNLASSILATQEQAQAGALNNVLMTPLRVKQAIPSLMPSATSTQIGGVKISGDDGVVVEEDGTLVVDFSKMPTDKFEELVQSIRVPIWITNTTDFYVNPVTGVDDAAAGYGISSAKPFKTIKYAITYITDNFNTSSYNVYINLAAGTYTDSSTSEYSSPIELPKFNGSGTIIIAGASNDYTQTVINNSFVMHNASNWKFQNLTLNPTATTSTGSGFSFLDISKGQLALQNVCFDLENVEESSSSQVRSIIYAQNYGLVQIYATSSASTPAGIYFNFRGKTLTLSPIRAVTGSVQFTADLNVLENLSTSSSFVIGNYLAQIAFTTSSLANPGRKAQVNLLEGATVTGKRYELSNNSICSTGGGGDEFIPGSISGTAIYGAQYN